MLYSENLTNRRLVLNAMPLVTLSRIQWNVLLHHFGEMEDSGNTELYEAMKTLVSNQSRIEVMGNYLDYFSDTLDEPVREKSVADFQIA